MPTTGGGAVTLAGLYFTDAPSVYLDGVQVSATQRYSPPSTKLISPSTEHVDSSFFLFFLFFLSFFFCIFFCIFLYFFVYFFFFLFFFFFFFLFFCIFFVFLCFFCILLPSFAFF